MECGVQRARAGLSQMALGTAGWTGPLPLLDFVNLWKSGAGRYGLLGLEPVEGGCEGENAHEA